MKHFRAKIKEVDNPSILSPEYIGDVTKKFLEKFWGCHNEDVEWFQIEEID